VPARGGRVHRQESPQTVPSAKCKVLSGMTSCE
jgi:hypothetical protein